MGIIKTTEVSTSLTTPVQVDAIMQTIIGRAPINLLDNPQSAVNTPILINDYAEAVSKLGFSEDYTNYESNQVVAMNFKNFAVAPFVFINVLDPTNSAHVTEVAATSKAIADKQIKLTDVGILLSTLEVSNGTGTTYTKDTDYTASFDDDGLVVINVLDGGAMASLTSASVGYKKLKPEGVTASDIIGGYTASSDTYKGIEAVEKVFPTLGVVPSMLLAPGFSSTNTVMLALKAKASSINGLFKANYICDADTTTVTNYTQLLAWKNNNAYTDKQMLLTWPKVKFGDNIFHSSIQLGARYATLVAGELDGVPCCYPSNEDASISGACLSNGTEVNLTLAQANQVTEYGVCTYLNFQGWKNWGVYTAAYPSNRDLKDYFNAIRVFFTWWNNTFCLTHFSSIDKTMSRKNIDRILDTENIRASAFTQNDQIANAYMTFEESENVATDIIAGKIKFHQHLSCYPPMNEIDNILEFDVSGLTNRLFGGNE